jgi:hypothetical protein
MVKIILIIGIFATTWFGGVHIVTALGRALGLY